MLNAKEESRVKLSAIDFAIHDIVLFLDSHPDNKKAIELLAQYRKWYDEQLADYEQKYGDYVTTVSDVKAQVPWSWIDGPWPWEPKEGES